MRENFNLGLTPQFTASGELAPEQIPLIEDGHLKNLLVSSRSAKEYGVASNGAELWEGPRSLQMAGGNLASGEVLKKLGTGVYLSHLHYLNWSDRLNARITGMTRYACFWVENGQIVAPISDMRFDESLYRMMGSELIDISQETQLIPAIDTYVKRGLGGRELPGLLLADFRLTL